MHIFLNETSLYLCTLTRLHYNFQQVGESLYTFPILLAVLKLTRQASQAQHRGQAINVGRLLGHSTMLYRRMVTGDAARFSKNNPSRLEVLKYKEKKRRVKYVVLWTSMT